MTWLQLLEILRNMQACDHTCMNKPVEFLNWDAGGSYFVTVIEDINNGNSYLTVATEDNDAA